MLKILSFVVLLLAMVGNSSATNQLSPVFVLPDDNSFLLVYVWNSPTPHGTPAICKEVQVSLIVADMIGDGREDSSESTIDIELVALSLVSVDPIPLAPGKGAKFRIWNDHEQGPKSVAVEIGVRSVGVQKVCGLKASAQVIMGGKPVGSPTDATDYFKPLTRSFFRRR